VAFGNGFATHVKLGVFDPAPGYGRVPVERIERYAASQAAGSGYHEINEFEHELTDDGVRIVKILVPCQRRGAEERMIDRMRSHKRYKSGWRDFRNIAKRKDTREATRHAERNRQRHAPWQVIASTNKALPGLTALR